MKFGRLVRPLQLLIVLTIVTYPLAVYLLIDTVGPRWLGLVLVLLLGLRLNQVYPDSIALPAICLGAVLVYLVAQRWGDETLILRLYPTIVSLGLLLSFAYTLVRPPTMVERLARASGMLFDHRAEPYGRAVTLLWCAFFLINAVIAAVIAVAGSMKEWMLYNGLVSYIIIGLIFAAEYLVRQLYLRRIEARSRTG